MGRSEAPSVENEQIQSQSCHNNDSYSVSQAGNLSPTWDPSVFSACRSNLQPESSSFQNNGLGNVDLSLNLLISSNENNHVHQSKRKHLSDTSVNVGNNAQEIRKNRSMSVGSLSHLTSRLKCVESCNSDASKRSYGIGNKIGNRNDIKKSENMKEMLKCAVSKDTKQEIEKLVSQVEKLGDLEKLFLYLSLPVGQSADIDPLKQNINPLGSRFEIGQTKIWIQTHLQEDPEVSLPKHEVYDDYLSYCTNNGMKPLSTADFGKVMKQVYPQVKPRRLGMRGKSRYCYAGLRKKANLKPPSLPFLGEIDCDCSVKGAENECEVMSAAHALVQEWAGKMFGSPFNNIIDLALYLVNKMYVDQDSVAAFTLISSVHDRQDLTHLTTTQESNKEVHSDNDMLTKHLEQVQRPCPGLLEQVSANRSTNEGDNLCDLSQVKCEEEAPGCPPLTTVISPCTRSTTPVVSPLNINNNLCLSSAAMVTASSQPPKPSVPSLALLASVPDPQKVNKIPIPRISCKKSLPNIIILPQTPTPAHTPSKLTPKSKYKPIQPKPAPTTLECRTSSVKPSLSESLSYVKRSRHVDWSETNLKDIKGEGKMHCTSVLTSRTSVMTPTSLLTEVEGKSDSELLSGYLAESSLHESERNEEMEGKKLSLCRDFSTSEDNGKTRKINEIRLILEQKLQRLPGSPGTDGLMQSQVLNGGPLCVVGVVSECEVGSLGGVAGMCKQGTPRRRVSFMSDVDLDKLPPLQETSASKVQSFQFTPITQSNVSVASTCSSYPSQPSSASQSPFVSPRTTPISNARSRHSSGQPTGYAVSLATMSDTPHSSNSSSTPFLPPLSTLAPCTRSRHSSLQNSRVAPYSVHGNVLSRKRNSSGGLSFALNNLPPLKGSAESKACDGEPEPFFIQPNFNTRGPRSQHSSGNMPSPLSAPHSPTLLPGEASDHHSCMLQTLLRTTQRAGTRYDPRRRHSSCVEKLNQCGMNSDLLGQEIATILDQSDTSNITSFVDSTELRSRSVPLSQMTAHDLLNYSHSHPTTPLQNHPFEFPLHESRSSQPADPNSSHSSNITDLEPTCEILPSVFDEQSLESMSVCEFARAGSRNDSYLHIEPSQEGGSDLSSDLPPFNTSDPPDDLSTAALSSNMKDSLDSFTNQVSSIVSRSHPSTPVTGFDTSKIANTNSGVSKSYPSTPVTYDDQLIGSNQITLNALNTPDFGSRSSTHCYAAKRNISQLWDVSPGDNDDSMLYDYDVFAKLLDENEN